MSQLSKKTSVLATLGRRQPASAPGISYLGATFFMGRRYKIGTPGDGLYDREARSPEVTVRWQANDGEDEEYGPTIEFDLDSVESQSISKKLISAVKRIRAQFGNVSRAALVTEVSAVAVEYSGDAWTYSLIPMPELVPEPAPQLFPGPGVLVELIEPIAEAA